MVSRRYHRRISFMVDIPQDQLIDLGYSVIEAGSAEAAVRLLDSGERFDLLVTDHLMPGLSGTELARAVRTSRPGVLSSSSLAMGSAKVLTPICRV